MPFRDREAKLAYQREWYASHRQRVIEKVRRRKYDRYGGTCKNCGARTIGDSKGLAAEYCSKPECRSVQFKGRLFR